MDTRFATSADSTRIAFDVSGAGSPIVLLHGGGGSRHEWHEAGYVARWQGEFTVIPVDLRGHGESDKYDNPACYSTEKFGQDILAVADACGLERFILCGYSFGGNVGRHLAARSDHISKLIMLGNRMGPGVSCEFRQFVFDLRARWAPVVEAARGSVFDPKVLPPKDQEDIGKLSFRGELLPAVLAWSTAMLNWETVTPSDLHCPTLWLIGSENRGAMDCFKMYEGELHRSNVKVRVLDGLDHEHEFKNIEKVLRVILGFVKKQEDT